jgi:hypothetical protein
MDSRNPPFCDEAEIKSQMPYHYTTGSLRKLPHPNP